jgi:hypothetical protein
MTRDEQKKLFREWEADYAARRNESAHAMPALPTPGQIAKDLPTDQPAPEHGQQRSGRTK